MVPMYGNPALFALLAREDVAIWRRAIGQVVTHARLGDGEITNVYQHPQGDGLRIEIFFATTSAKSVFQLSSRSSRRSILDVSPFLNGMITEMTVPPDLRPRLEQLRDNENEREQAIQRASEPCTQLSGPILNSTGPYWKPSRRQAFRAWNKAMPPTRGREELPSTPDTNETSAIRPGAQASQLSSVPRYQATLIRPSRPTVPTFEQRAAQATTYLRRKIYHITHLNNLEGIIAAGCLWSEARIARTSLKTTRIGHSHLKSRRMLTWISECPDWVVGDYVPFYFAPRSPMLYSILKRNVDGYAGGQRPIVHLVSSIEKAITGGTDWLFTDGNATSRTSRFFTTLSDLSRVDWRLMEARYWNCTESDPDRERRRAAEFLVLDSFPWQLIEAIAVIDNTVADMVKSRIRGQSHQPNVVVIREWYY